ncbi:MAG: DUF1772 domain-containing protein [Proteobacteria bacterium]|nr:DUF1772 domain-containing protein [Pseudomonadota bacterium]MDA1057763.1 DUF1772 domain-containing protein [Pseudomonadota bacterium]
MTSEFAIYAGVAVVVAHGLVAGVFLTFSDFVMRSLRRVSPESGIAAMQAINRTVYGSVFLAMFISLAAVSLVLVVGAVAFAEGAAAAWIGAGSALYIGGVFLVTVVVNVPMNKRLDAMDHAAPETAAYWTEYAVTWTRWNHVRSFASAGSALCLLVGTLRLAGA